MFIRNKDLSQQTLNPRQRIQLPRNPPNPLPIPHTHALATFLAIHEPRDLRIHILLPDPTGTPLVHPPFYLLSAVHFMALSFCRRRIEGKGAGWEVPWFVVDEATAGDGVCVREDSGAEFFAGCE
jgi:hypothetical protein